MRWLKVTAGLAVPGSVALFYAAFIFAPTEAFMGDVQRLFYIHVATAWNAYLCFAVVLFSGLAYLFRRAPRWDWLGTSAAEVGVLFTTATLVSGSIWAKAVWGHWWTWEPRLTLTFITWLMYIGYLILRRSIANPEVRSRTAAVYGVLAFVNIPLVHYSVQWWRSIHPFTIGSGRDALHPDMRTALMIATVAATLLAVTLLGLRQKTAVIEGRLDAGGLAGDGLRG